MIAAAQEINLPDQKLFRLWHRVVQMHFWAYKMLSWDTVQAKIKEICGIGSQWKEDMN